MRSLMLVGLLALCSLVGGVALLGGCSTVGSPPGSSAQVLSPVQVASIACPQVNLVHVQLVAFNAALTADPATADLGRKATAQLAVIHPMVQKVCNGTLASSTVDASSLQALVQTGLPALGTLASSLPLPPDQQLRIQSALVIAETAAGVVNALKPMPAPSASSGAPPLSVAPSSPSSV